MTADTGRLLKQCHRRVILVHDCDILGLYSAGGGQAFGPVLRRLFLTLHIFRDLVRFSHFMLVLSPGRIG
ncbi:hypothetical protein D3C76_1376250 [compost metagenome]